MDGSIPNRHRDLAISARGRDNGGGVEDSHLQTGRVAPTSSNRGRFADQAHEFGEP